MCFTAHLFLFQLYYSIFIHRRAFTSTRALTLVLDYGPSLLYSLIQQLLGSYKAKSKFFYVLSLLTFYVMFCSAYTLLCEQSRQIAIKTNNSLPSRSPPACHHPPYHRFISDNNSILFYSTLNFTYDTPRGIRTSFKQLYARSEWIYELFHACCS